MEKLADIGLVGGGQMAEALIRGMVESGLLKGEQITVADPSLERREHLHAVYGVRVAAGAEELARRSSIVILAVKPQIFAGVAAEYRRVLGPEHLVVSIMAGIGLAVMAERLGRELRIIRAMPNTPSLVLSGAAALAGNAAATAEDLETAATIFRSVGTCVQVPEPMLDAVTGLSGSGPGYVFTFLEAMIDGGVLAGLPRPMAEELVLQTVYGAVRLAMETGDPPAVLRGRVTSPAGTTIAGLGVLEEAGFRGTVMRAVAAAAERSRELGA